MKKTNIYSMTIKKITLAVMLILTVAVLTACSKQQPVDDKATYKAELTEYYNQINTASVSINNIDVSQPGGATLLLSCLDSMQQSFNGLANMSVPSRYEPLQPLTKEANESFNQAYLIYHEIYAGENLENFDADKAIVAATYYQEAMNKLVQLGKSIMSDENPESVSQN